VTMTIKIWHYKH